MLHCLLGVIHLWLISVFFYLIYLIDAVSALLLSLRDRRSTSSFIFVVLSLLADSLFSIVVRLFQNFFFIQEKSAKNTFYTVSNAVPPAFVNCPLRSVIGLIPWSLAQGHIGITNRVESFTHFLAQVSLA